MFKKPNSRQRLVIHSWVFLSLVLAIVLVKVISIYDIENKIAPYSVEEVTHLTDLWWWAGVKLVLIIPFSFLVLGIIALIFYKLFEDKKWC